MTSAELVENNLGLVRASMKRFIGKGIEPEELYAAGCLGLVKASAHFDESLGFRFSTYAVPVILGEMRRLFRDGGTVKVSRSLKELSMRARAAADEFQKKHGQDISMAKLAETLGVDVYQANEALCASMSVLSLSAENDGEGCVDVPVDSGEEEITERLSLEEALSSLEEDERRLIHLRYFLGKTQTDAAAALGISQVQVSRKEKKILMKMREKLS